MKYLKTAIILTNQNCVIFSCIILIYLQHSEIKFFLYTNYLSADQVFEFVIKFQVFFWSRHFTCYHSLYLQCLCQLNERNFFLEQINKSSTQWTLSPAKIDHQINVFFLSGCHDDQGQNYITLKIYMQTIGKHKEKCGYMHCPSQTYLCFCLIDNFIRDHRFECFLCSRLGQKQQQKLNYQNIANAAAIMKVTLDFFHFKQCCDGQSKPHQRQLLTCDVYVYRG